MTDHNEFQDLSYDELDIRKRVGIISDITEIGDDIYRMRLRLETPMQHYPGQYILVDYDLEGKRVARAYTMISSAVNPNEIELAIQRTEDPLTSHIVTGMKEGDEFKFRGPYGHFVWNERIGGDTLTFVAVNIGINPFISMLRYILDKQLAVSVKLLYHLDDGGDVVPYKNVLDGFQRAMNFSYEVVENINEYDNWEKSDRLYICGEKRVTNPLVEKLKEKGIEYTKLEQWF